MLPFGELFDVMQSGRTKIVSFRKDFYVHSVPLTWPHIAHSLAVAVDTFRGAYRCSSCTSRLPLHRLQGLSVEAGSVWGRLAGLLDIKYYANQNFNGNNVRKVRI